MRRLARTGLPGSCPLMIVCVSTGDNMGYLVAVGHAVCDCMGDDVTGWERRLLFVPTGTSGRTPGGDFDRYSISG
jgi:hypothetical protein